MTIASVISGEARWCVEHGDSLAVLKGMADNSVDSVVTDPPAGIAFMAKKWDDTAWMAPISESGLSDGGVRLKAPTIAPGGARNPMCKRCKRHLRGWKDVPGCECVEGADPDSGAHARRTREVFVAYLTAILAECYRVTKPGGRMLCWSIPRTMHWTGMAIEDAGWIIENTIAHVFGSGFPKAKSQIKPAREDWWLCRKPAKNVLPLNIDACRVATASADDYGRSASNAEGFKAAHDGFEGKAFKNDERAGEYAHAGGRWPANLVLSHSPGCVLVGTKRVKATSIHGEATAVRRSGAHSEAGGHQTIGREQPVHGYADADGKESIADYECAPGCPVAILDELSGVVSGAVSNGKKTGSGYGEGYGVQAQAPSYGDTGGASRFFNTFEADAEPFDADPFVYFAKASRKDRNEGCESSSTSNDVPSTTDDEPVGGGNGVGVVRNAHPT